MLGRPVATRPRGASASRRGPARWRRTGEVLKVSPSAVEKYVTNIFLKLDLPPTGTDHRRVLAVLKYLGT